jgi:WD40 repeat protein
LPKVEESWSANIQTLEGHSSSVNSVAVSSDSRLLASGSNDHTIKLWDPSACKLLQTLEGHSDWVNSVAFSSDSRLLASGSSDHTVKLWDPSTGELRQTLEGHSNWVWTENSSGMSILEGKWLCLHGEKILWLAQEYRPTCLAINDGILALGHKSGRVSFLSPRVL